jgi:hypothetical protein
VGKIHPKGSKRNVGSGAALRHAQVLPEVGDDEEEWGFGEEEREADQVCQEGF